MKKIFENFKFTIDKYNFMCYNVNVTRVLYKKMKGTKKWKQRLSLIE